MAEPKRGSRIGLAILAAICVPFITTGVYRLTARFDSPAWLWALLPFALPGAAAVLIRRGPTWTAVSNGLIVGLVLYGLFLVWLVSEFFGTPFPD